MVGLAAAADEPEGKLHRNKIVIVPSCEQSYIAFLFNKNCQFRQLADDKKASTGRGGVGAELRASCIRYSVEINKHV